MFEANHFKFCQPRSRACVPTRFGCALNIMHVLEVLYYSKTEAQFSLAKINFCIILAVNYEQLTTPRPGRISSPPLVVFDATGAAAAAAGAGAKAAAGAGAAAESGTGTDTRAAIGIGIGIGTEGGTGTRTRTRTKVKTRQTRKGE